MAIAGRAQHDAMSEMFPIIRFVEDDWLLDVRRHDDVKWIAGARFGGKSDSKTNAGGLSDYIS